MDPSSDTMHAELPAELQQLMESVSRRLKRYVLLSGLLGLIIAAVTVFWITTGLDLGWFALRHLELPVGLRISVLVLMIVGALWLLLQSVVLPSLRRIHDRDTAVLLERRFPQFGDRLITAVEGTSGLKTDGPLSRGMLNRTVREARMLAASATAEAVFDLRPLKRRVFTAGLLLLSLGGVTVASPQTIPRWWNAFVRCQDVYHERTTDLRITAIQQPGRRRLEIGPSVDRWLYRHPRGTDLELELTVPDAPRPDGRPWVVPPRIRIDVRRVDGTVSRTWLSAAAPRTFRFVMTRLQEDVDIDLLAGDLRLPRPLRIRAVEPPGFDHIVAHCDYPAYTGWNRLRSTSRTVTGSELALPVGTAFELEAVSTKPLQALRVATDTFELTGNQHSAQRTEGGRLSETVLPPVLDADAATIRIRFRLVPDRPAGSGDMTESDLDDSSEPDGKVSEWESTGGELAVTPGTMLRFSLHDQDDVVSTRPVVLRIAGIPDRPPVLEVRPEGIDRAVTRRAVIPFSGRIRDDYGLKSAGFEFLVDDQTQWRPRPFSQPVPSDAREFRLDRSESGAGPAAERFQVEPLDLTEGQTLSLAVSAVDNCGINGPQTARSEPVVFRVVSSEELLSMLYTREISLRRRFEQVIQELIQVQKDLDLQEQVARRLETSETESRRDDRIGLTTSATRSADVLRRQANELKSILQGFDGIIQQLINNAIPPARLADTMRQNILEPLNRVIESDLPRADLAMSVFRVAAADQRPTRDLIRTADQQISRVIVRLRSILENVRDMAEFHEVLSDLRAMREEQKRILEETRRIKRRQLIDEL